MRASEINAIARGIFLKIGPARIAVLLLVLAQKSLRTREPNFVSDDMMEFSRSRVANAYEMLTVTIHRELANIGHEMSPELRRLCTETSEILRPLGDLCASHNSANDVFMTHLIAYDRLESDCIAGFVPISTDFVNLFISELDAVSEAAHRIEKQKSATSLDEVADVGMRIQMVAINASIEAARAGEVGRGFSVIADETKLLAQTMTTVLGEISDDLRRI